MPVVELSRSRLQNLVGRVSSKQLYDSLPFIGLDIESEDGDTIRVEYSPNRPDYSTDYGISLGLQGLLGINTGLIRLKIKKPAKLSLAVEWRVTGIRPYITGIAARGGKVDDLLIRQLVSMQEDLHLGMGRRRKKSSIGIHDLDKISFPITYTTANRTHSFVPLDSTSKLTASEILRDTGVGREYGKILGNSKHVPIILDSDGNTVSFPPVINAAATALTHKTKNIFVEVTGNSKSDVEDVLSVVALVLQTAGFSLEAVDISGVNNSSPMLSSRRLVLDPDLVGKTLGLNLSVSTISSSLRRARLGVSLRDGSIVCIVPPYRFDIMGPMDLVEEVALGYGVENLEPSLSPSCTIGQAHHIPIQLKTLGQLMVGLGYMEALNSSLTSKRILCDLSGRSDRKIISVIDPKNREYTVLRDSIMPGLVDVLSRNIHYSYPQKLFETGIVFRGRNQISETVNVGCVSAHRTASFTEAKSVLQSLLDTGFGIRIQTRMQSVPPFREGRTAAVVVDGKMVGFVGEIDPDVCARYKIRVPVAGFEVYLSGLIFD